MPKRVFIEIPTWLGDAVMATPAMETLVSHFPHCKLTVFGSYVSTRLFLRHPNVEKIIIDESKQQGNRYYNLYSYAKEASEEGAFDMALSLRRQFTSKVLLLFVRAKDKWLYRRYEHKQIHQVVRYNEFINRCLSMESQPGDLTIYCEGGTSNEVHSKPVLGINPGATYGSAKRWYPKECAKVAIALAHDYDIIIFGGPGEREMAQDIEEELRAANVENYTNLAGQTTIPELLVGISRLSLFITNDSGPMHVAAAFKIPTVSIFGPTRYIETRQWKNPGEIIVRKELECAPCMKRVCPLGTHECMKSITADDVLREIRESQVANKLLR